MLTRKRDEFRQQPRNCRSLLLLLLLHHAAKHTALHWPHQQWQLSLTWRPAAEPLLPFVAASRHLITASATAAQDVGVASMRSFPVTAALCCERVCSHVACAHCAVWLDDTSRSDDLCGTNQGDSRRMPCIVSRRCCPMWCPPQAATRCVLVAYVRRNAPRTDQTKRPRLT